MRAEEGERDRGADGERATRKMAKVGGAEERREAGGSAGRPRPKSERQNILTHETAIHLYEKRNEIRPHRARARQTA